MCVRCGTGSVAWCTDPFRHEEWVAGRGGNGRNGDGSWPEHVGGCPQCGQIRGGGHGGGCENTQRYDEYGNVIA